MASTWNSLKRIVGVTIPTSMAVLAIGSGAAWAQTTYNVAGSDTLTEVINKAIQLSGAKINYQNIGSGQGEKNIANIPTVTQKQSIAPMSRNFVPTVLPLGFAPTSDNVLCLDAAINAVGNIPGHMQNLPCSATSGSSICDNTCDVNVNPLLIALGGYPASCAQTPSVPGVSKATTAECGHPQRIAALGKLAALQGARIDHFFRRDDKSGTQDTFREKIQFDRWCNGKSEGNNNAVGSNLQNYDLDPIRKTCVNEHGQSVAETRCSYYPLNLPAVGQTCYNGDVLAANAPGNTYGVAIPCTQGWIVALSETDPGQKDITTSIGARIGLDFNGFTMGGGGLAVANANSIGVTLNTVSFEDFNVRGGFYAMWRRLFLQHRSDCLAYTGDAGRCAEETKLWNWASNRQNMCTVCASAGFYSPIPGCSQACDDPLNVTCVAAEAGLGTPKMNIGAETTACNVDYPCVANGNKLSGGTCGGVGANCPVIPVETAGYACNMSVKCTSSSCSGTPAVCQ